MDIPSWLGFDQLRGVGDDVTSSPLGAASTFFNAFQALSGNHTTDGPVKLHPRDMIGDVLLAMCGVAISRQLYHFVMDTWPSWVMRFLSRCFSTHRTKNAAAVDVFSQQPEEFVFDNELLVHAMERYVAHLLSLSAETQQQANTHTSDVTTTTTTTTTTTITNDNNNNNNNNNNNSNTSNDSVRRLDVQLLRTAEFRYLPITSLESVCRSGLANILRRYFRLVLLPADGHTVEVEPGLTVCFQQQRVAGGVLAANKIVPRRREKQQEQQEKEEDYQQQLMKEFLPLNFDTKHVKFALSSSGSEKSNEDSEDTDGSYNSDDAEDSDADGTLSMGGTGKEFKQFVVRQAVLQCTDCKSGKERILDFARRAYAWYYPTVVEPIERYYFYPANSELEEAIKSTEYVPSEVTQRLHMRRSLLSQGRNSFHTLFFQEKSHLIDTLSEFKEKKGKFAVPGVAQQLLILLYGPPGTGKTSVVRSVASFLNRHIVAIPIEFIQTNSALYELLTGGTTMLHGETRVETVEEDWSDCTSYEERKPICYDLSTDQVVYVFEDIDVVADMISFQMAAEERRDFSIALTHARNEKEQNKEDTTTTNDNDSNNNSSSSSSSTSSSTTTENASSSHTLDSEAEKENKTHEEDSKEREESNEDNTADQMKQLLSYQKLLASDFLSPEGLLRALEPTFSPAGRVIIFTTNHIDRLPDVFWKPGLLTLAIHMDILNAERATQLVTHYYSESMTPELQKRFEEMFTHFESEGTTSVMTPAWLQQFILNCDNLEDLLQELESRR